MEQGKVVCKCGSNAVMIDQEPGAYGNPDLYAVKVTCQVCRENVTSYLVPEWVALSQWQPIETAPKDGTQVLCAWVHKTDDGQLWDSGFMHVLAYFPEWDEHGGAWVLDGDFAVKFEPDNIHETPPRRNGDPTHWMPLPSPPEKP